MRLGTTSYHGSKELGKYVNSILVVESSRKIADCNTFLVNFLISFYLSFSKNGLVAILQNCVTPKMSDRYLESCLIV